jgi:hypothetical protein
MTSPVGYRAVRTFRVADIIVKKRAEEILREIPRSGFTERFTGMRRPHTNTMPA